MGIKSNLTYLIVHSWRISKGLFFIITFKSIVQAVKPLINITGIGLVVNALVVHKSFGEVLGLIIAYVSFILVFEIVEHLLTLLDNIYQRRCSNIMQFEYMDDCLNIDYHYVQDHSILDMKRKSMGAHPISFLSHYGRFMHYLIQVLGIIYIVSMLSPIFLFAMLITSILLILSTFKLRAIEFAFSNRRIEEDRQLDYLYRILTDYRYAKEIRLSNGSHFISNKYQKIIDSQTKKLKAFMNKIRVHGILAVGITVLQTSFMYAYFSFKVFNDRISLAEYTILISSTTLLTTIIYQFFDVIAKIKNSCKYADIYREYKQIVEERSSISNSNILDHKVIDINHLTILFENVSFCYPNTSKVILRNINLEINNGDRIGIVGLNGSGKSTLVKLLLRIYDPTSGKITINGIDLIDIPYREYIKNFGVVLQDFFLFAYSIRENICFNLPYDELKLLEIIEKSDIKDKVDSLKNGIHTSVYKELDDEGIELSGGEGQKIAMARALYKEASILILDEPTSHLDPIAEFEFFSNLNRAIKDKTILFITHRLSSTKFCDKIIVIRDESIVECGSHNELMKMNGVYAELYNAQASLYQQKGEIIHD